MGAPLKLTKNEYRLRKDKLARLESYLPTLKLKKALLQAEVQGAMTEAELCKREYESVRGLIYSMAELFSIPLYIRNIEDSFRVSKVNKRIENVAGVEVPVFEGVEIRGGGYSLLDTPIWVDSLVESSKKFVEAKIKSEIASERSEILQKELRNISIRVNLFEKKLIPETKASLRKISVFLSDRAMVDVGQNKMAKKKIEKKKEALHEN